MRKLILPMLLAVTAQTALAAPVSPLASYNPTDIAREGISVDRLWRGLDANMKGKDCYKRAHLWTYDMYRNYNVKSKKIFVHYSRKWNRVLDDLGSESLYGGFLGLNTVRRKTLDYPGISSRDMGVIHGNKRWVYHVAPVVVNNRVDTVLDKTLRLAYDANPKNYSNRQGWKLYARPSTPREWMEGLTIRGEILWKIRRSKMKEELKEASYSERQSIKREMKKLGMINRYGSEVSRIDIKCKKVDSIADADRLTEKEWCFWTEAPMYYWNEIDLRQLAYGRTGYNYSWHAPQDVHTERNYQNGRDYVQYNFNQDEVEMSEGERKH